MSVKRKAACFNEWLCQHSNEYIFGSANPLVSTRAWAAAVRVEANRPGWPECDLARAAPEKRERLVVERQALLAASERYVRAWDAVKKAFIHDRSEPELSRLLVELARLAEEIKWTFTAFLIDPDKSVTWDRGKQVEEEEVPSVTIFECVRDGVEVKKRHRSLPVAGNKGNLEKGKGRRDAVAEAYEQWLSKNPGRVGRRGFNAAAKEN